MSKKIRTVNDNLELVTIDDIVNHKLISDEELNKDLANINKYDAIENENNFAGNPFLYHYQLKNLLKCRRQDGKTIYDIYNDKEAWDKLIEQTKLRNRGGRTAAGNVFECFRINLGSVVMFKATTAKYLYKKYKVKSVLDPTAGWGGRMLGAVAAGALPIVLKVTLAALLGAGNACRWVPLRFGNCAHSKVRPPTRSHWSIGFSDCAGPSLAKRETHCRAVGCWK